MPAKATAELIRVLAYRKFKLSDEDQYELLADLFIGASRYRKTITP